MKANHNPCQFRDFTVTLWSISVNQRMKANHNLRVMRVVCRLLWSISVNQRMKANHNAIPRYYIKRIVVVNISKSKNESKSQRTYLRQKANFSCGQYQ